MKMTKEIRQGCRQTATRLPARVRTESTHTAPVSMSPLTSVPNHLIGKNRFVHELWDRDELTWILLSLHECRVQIGAMNGCVAHGAGLIFLGLVVRRSQWAQRRSAVTLQAQQVDLGHAQEARIRRAVRRMAAHAAFRLHRHVLIDEGSLLFGVTLVADRVASGSRAHLA